MHQLLDYECPGEYEVKDDGFYKGEVKLDENNDLVDGLSKLSGVISQSSTAIPG
jgi:hypothetical protein